MKANRTRCERRTEKTETRREERDKEKGKVNESQQWSGQVMSRQGRREGGRAVQTFHKRKEGERKKEKKQEKEKREKEKVNGQDKKPLHRTASASGQSTSGGKRVK